MAELSMKEKYATNPSGRLNPIEEDLILQETFYSGETADVYYRPDPGDEKAGKDFGGHESFKKQLKQDRRITAEGILVDRDMAIPLRDGTIIYADLYRPADRPMNLPVIVSWGFYGKGDSELAQDWNVMGVPAGAISPMAKFESCDPACWCPKGYAVLNVDGRGCGLSQGNCVLWGEQDGRDGYDAIEWIATQPWSNGKVGLFGNSALAMCQWWIAAEQPPHLAAIAPWEGTSDIYREFICEGGIPWPGFSNMVLAKVRSTGYIEDLCGNLEKHPLMDAYWQAKVPNFKKISCPAYVAAGWLHIHLRGTLNGFRKMGSRKKWLRVHRDYEWPDTYNWKNIDDLDKFFERYLKDVRNGWEMTPPVRLEIMDAYDYDFQVNRPETSWPLKRTQYTKLYLNASDGSMGLEPVAEAAKVSYNGNEGLTTFDYTFPEDTEVTGYLKLHTWIAAEEHDDCDVFVTVQKTDEEGNMIPVYVVSEPHPGAWGKMRVSHRELDPELSTDFQPVMAHKRELKLEPGVPVECDIEIYPTARMFHAGERIRVEIAGRYIRDENWFINFPYITDNKGDTSIYAGGEYDSYLQIPVIPPKYQTKGGYVYR